MVQCLAHALRRKGTHVPSFTCGKEVLLAAHLQAAVPQPQPQPGDELGSTRLAERVHMQGYGPLHRVRAISQCFADR